ncbi:kinase-like protein [Westerdykella ornata]|uniref:Kinase-like protein n=1 Tax=Westerdykella ornata TaxID=318751 RepID=A0A6A6JPT4_WESOR|nr:kinase-like protein [Westerdykella ornata]KAF2278274.1 kinase-like protein [Westerdykella ornata]
MAITNLEHDRELFEYTSGRWLYNESLRLAERRLVFNVDELKKAAANAMNMSVSDIANFSKLAEGGFNRVFEISMKDGSSILARLPYPSTIPRRLAVASEVATLDFVRAQGVPTPRVLGYSVDDNPVGSEYILMEKLPGRPIGDAWYELSEKDRLKVLFKTVEFEAKLFAANLPASGSIYYARDLPPSIQKVDIPGSADGLCIGPYVSEEWWFGERGQLRIDRGPHDDSLVVLRSPAGKELAWIRAFGRRRFPFQRAYRETLDYKKQDPEDHKKSLKEYIALAEYLIPKETQLNQPVLRHHDLQPNNISISEDFDITGIIDWQHSTVLPTFLAAGIPKYFQNYDDEESQIFSPPKYPAGLETMEEDDRAAALEQFRRRHVHFFYLGFTQRMNEPHWRALEQAGELLKRRIFTDAGNPWEGLNTPLQLDILNLVRNLSEIATANTDGTTPTCPVLDEALREVDSTLETVRSAIGISSDGWMPNERYEASKAMAKWVKERGLAEADGDPWLKEMSERHWPFDDHDEEE